MRGVFRRVGPAKECHFARAWAASGFGFSFDLAHRLRHHLTNDAAYLMFGLLDALGIEIAPHLAEHIFITRLGQVGLDHLDGISLCLVAAGVISARLALEAALGGDNR
jgi:hypothetical protein